jgi:signal peptidase II
LDQRLVGMARAVATAAVVVVLDQATKQAAVSSLGRGERRNVFFGLDLTNTHNKGVAFGALQGGGLIVALLIGLALALVVCYFALNATRALLWLPVGLLVGGALGNLADRAREGAVIDFIDPIAWPAFNLADASIVIGVVALLYLLEGGRDESRAARD